MLGNRDGGKQRDQAVGSKVTKHDVFHSEIYYNTTNQRPQRAWARAGGFAEAGVPPATAASPGQRKGF